MLQPAYHWQQPEIVPSSIKTELDVYSPAFQSILFNRGVTTNQAAIDLLLPREPGWTRELFPRGTDAACEIIHNAINKKHKIAVYGDYDADGITATALAALALRQLKAEVIPYIPDRLEEGYGLNQLAIQDLADQGAKLLITVDNGIKSHQEIDFANALGMKTIVTDHHTPVPPIPAANAVINPKLHDDPYPNKELAGVGVVYKLICSLAKIYQNISPDDFLDLVAIGTIADIVPLVGENRYLVRQGLSRINLKNRPGVQALLGVSGLSGKSIQSSDISFQLAPRLNSSGRLEDGSAETPLSLLVSDSVEECGRLAQILENDNYRRKSLSRKIELKLDKHFSSQTVLEPILFYVDDTIPQGIAGIAAGYLARKFNRPAIVGSSSENQTVASCRSIPAFSMINALNSASDLFERYGGHDQAAGFTIDNDNLQTLQTLLAKKASMDLDGLDLRPRLEIDAEVPFSEIGLPLFKELQKLEPTGEKNPAPVLVTKNLRARDKKLIGKNKSHIKFLVSDKNKSLDAIGFSLGHIASQIPASFDLAYHLTLNEFRGQKKIQLQIIDIKPSEQN